MRRTLPPLAVIAVLVAGSQAQGDPTDADTAMRETITAPAPVATPPAARGARVQLYTYLESFLWEEHIENIKIVDEEGFLAGAGVAFERQLAAPTFSGSVFGKVDAFFGQTDYEGGVQNEDGTSEPLSSNSTYVGLRGQLALGLPITLGETARLMPYAGLGTFARLRTLDTDLSDDDIGPLGYEEFWVTLHGVLGARATLPLDANRSLFVSGQVNLPVWTEVDADLSNVGGPGDSRLEPKHKTGWRAEAGFDAGRLGISAFYEAENYGQSDVNEDDLLQPESQARILGARASIAL